MIGNQKSYYERTRGAKKPVQTRFKQCVGWPNPTAKFHCGATGQARMMGEGAKVCPQCGAPQVDKKRKK